MFVLFPRQRRRLQEHEKSEKEGGIAKQTQDMRILRIQTGKEFTMKTTSNQTYMYQRWSTLKAGMRAGFGSRVSFGSDLRQMSSLINNAELDGIGR